MGAKVRVQRADVLVLEGSDYASAAEIAFADVVIQNGRMVKNKLGGGAVMEAKSSHVYTAKAPLPQFPPKPLSDYAVARVAAALNEHMDVNAAVRRARTLLQEAAKQREEGYT